MSDNLATTRERQPASSDKDISRRRLLGTVGAAGATGLVLGAAGGAAAHAAAAGDTPTALTTLGSTGVDFHGAHQAGITTPLQACGHLIAFDLAPGAGRKEAAALMRRWSALAGDLMAGRSAGDGDTGVALDAGPSSLTVTFGFGRTFFDRTGLTAQRPPELDPLPAFSSDQLDAKRSNGDLWVQIGADDALVAFHALRAIQQGGGGRGPGAMADERLQPLARRHRKADDRPQSDGPDRRLRQPETVRAGLRQADLRAVGDEVRVAAGARTPSYAGSACCSTTGRNSR